MAFEEYEKTFVGDAHVHPRELPTVEFGESLPIYARNYFAVYMLNFEKPLDISDPLAACIFLQEYVDEIGEVARLCGNPKHIPLLMPVLNDQMTPTALDRFIAGAEDIRFPLAGFKLFPRGQSTNSGYAPPLDLAVKLIDVVEAHGLPLALHLEDPNEPNASKKEESAIRNILPKIVYKDGKKNGKRRHLPIIGEHLTDEYSVREAMRLDLWMTITPHHLVISQEALGITDPSQAEYILQTKYPYFYCKPIVQTRKNQEWLRDFWLSGKYGKLMIGTDSAPHTIDKKEANPPKAGIMFGDAELAYDLVGPSASYLVERYSLNACKCYGLNPTPADIEEYKRNRTGPNEDTLFRVKNGRDEWLKRRGGR